MAFLSHVAIAPELDALDGLGLLVSGLQTEAARRGLHFLTLGLAETDPRVPVLKARLHARDYRWRLYWVRWPEMDTPPRTDRATLSPEVALL
jgi:hypothetical protein